MLKQAMMAERERLEEQIGNLERLERTSPQPWERASRKVEEGIVLKILQRWSMQEESKKLKERVH